MTKYLTLAVLAVAFASSSTQTEAGDCCVPVPKECVPTLRVPAENYVPYPELLTPPQPVAYSIWYYNLYEPFCKGRPERDCIWACVPVVHSVVKARY